jgi:hypothetical protein
MNFLKSPTGISGTILPKTSLTAARMKIFGAPAFLEIIEKYTAKIFFSRGDFSE